MALEKEDSVTARTGVPRFLILSQLLVLTSPLVHASYATINDDCAAPLVITALPFTDSRDIATATTTAADPVQSCSTQPSQNFQSIWYRFTPTASGMLLADTSGSEVDAVLSVHTGTCGALTEVACTTRGRVSFFVTAGQTILVELTSESALIEGKITLNVKAVAAAANDECSAPTIIPAMPFRDTLNISAATFSASDPQSRCSNQKPNVWYRYTAPADGTVIVATDSDGIELAAYAGTCEAPTELMCSDNQEIEFPVTAGQTVLLEASRTDDSATDALFLTMAGPLSNDECTSPKLIAPLPFSDTVDPFTATPSPSDPPLLPPGSNVLNSVWYSFTAPAAGTVTASLTGGLLAAFSGTCGALTQLAFDWAFDSRVSVPVTAGQTILFEVAQIQDFSSDSVFTVNGPWPPSDDCGTAPAIGATPFSATSDVSSATASPSDPVQSCTFPAPAQNARSVWYNLVAPASGTLVADTSSSDYDTILTAYSGSCGALAEIACNDEDDQFGSQSSVHFPVMTGQRVLFEITEFPDDPFGGQTLVFNLKLDTSLTNDLCEGAPTVLAGAPFSDMADSTWATASASDPTQSCTGAQNSSSVWYSFVATSDGIVLAETRDSDFRPVMDAHTGSCSALTELACNDPTALSTDTHIEEARVAIPVTAGEKVFLELSTPGTDPGGSSTSGGASNLRVSPCATLAPVRLVMNKLLDPPGDERLLLKAGTTLPATFVSALNPLADGVRLFVNTANGRSVLDVTLPPGAFADPPGVGWKVKQNTWAYVDKRATAPEGIRKVSIRKSAASVVSLEVDGRGGTYDVSAGDLPLTAVMALDAGGSTQCGAARFGGSGQTVGCAFNKSGSKLRCR